MIALRTHAPQNHSTLRLQNCKPTFGPLSGQPQTRNRHRCGARFYDKTPSRIAGSRIAGLFPDDSVSSAQPCPYDRRTSRHSHRPPFPGHRSMALPDPSEPALPRARTSEFSAAEIGALAHLYRGDGDICASFSFSIPFSIFFRFMNYHGRPSFCWHFTPALAA